MRMDGDQKRLLAIVGGLTLAFVLGLWLPQQMRETRLRRQIDAAREQIAREQQAVRGLTALSTEVAMLQTALEQDPRQVPDSGEQASLLRQLSADLAAEQMSEREVVSQAALTGADFSVLPLTVKFRGSFDQVLGLINRVETMKRLVRVSKLSLSGQPGQPRQDLEGQMEICAFFGPDTTTEKPR